MQSYKHSFCVSIYIANVHFSCLICMLSSIKHISLFKVVHSYIRTIICDFHVSVLCTHLHHFGTTAFSAPSPNDRFSLTMALPENVCGIWKQSSSWIYDILIYIQFYILFNVCVWVVINSVVLCYLKLC